MCVRPRAGRAAAGSVLLWREGARCCCIFSELPHIWGSGELSSAVSQPNEPWHCLTAKQAHSHS